MHTAAATMPIKTLTANTTRGVETELMNERRGISTTHVYATQLAWSSSPFASEKTNPSEVDWQIASHSKG